MPVDLLALPAPLTYTDVRRVGGTREDVRRLLRSGALMPLSRGLFVAREFWFDADSRARHAVLCRAGLSTAPVGAAVSHESAALLHGLETLAPWSPSLPRLTAPVPRECRVPASGRVRVQRAALPAAHVTVVDGLPITTIARTVVDLARGVPFDAAVVLADSALRRGDCSVGDLHAVYCACRQWPGALAAGRVVHFADPLAESPLESVVRARLHQQGVPAPATQVEIVVDGFRYRADFLWEAERTIGEADGMVKYTDASVLRQEKLREDRLRDAGFEVVRITWDDIASPATVAGRAWRAFARGRRLR